MLTNRKPAHRQGKVQLIDASQWFRPLRKNLGKKNCELSDADTQRIVETYLAFKETPESKIFPNAAFGYWKVVVERPLRLRSQLSAARIAPLRFASGDEDLRADLYSKFGDKLFAAFASVEDDLTLHLEAISTGDDVVEVEDEDEPTKPDTSRAISEKVKKRLRDPATWARDGRLAAAAEKLATVLGRELFTDHNVFRERVDAACQKLGLKLTAADLKTILRAVSWRDEAAPPVIAKIHKPGKATANPLHGLYPVGPDLASGRSAARPSVLEYEPDPDLRDTEQIPLLEAGGITAFIQREVLPYTPDAWVKADATKIGYEVSFTRHFYKPAPLRTLAEIRADILAVEKEAEGLLADLLHGGEK